MKKSVVSIGLLFFVMISILGLRSVLQPREPLRPKIEVQCNESLGSQLVNFEVVGEFVVKNLGNSPLILHSFRTSCSCAGVESEVDGKHVRVDQEEIPAQSSKSFRVRIMTNGEAGRSQVVVLSFQHNDQSAYPVQLRFNIEKLLGRPSVSTSLCQFGNVSPKATASRHLAVYSNQTRNLTIKSVTCSYPLIISTRLYKASDVPNQIAADYRDGLTSGEIAFIIELVLKCDEEKELDGVIAINFSADKIANDTLFASFYAKIK